MIIKYIFYLLQLFVLMLAKPIIMQEGVPIQVTMDKYNVKMHFQFFPTPDQAKQPFYLIAFKEIGQLYIEAITQKELSDQIDIGSKILIQNNEQIKNFDKFFLWSNAELGNRDILKINPADVHCGDQCIYYIRVRCLDQCAFNLTAVYSHIFLQENKVFTNNGIKEDLRLDYFFTTEASFIIDLRIIEGGSVKLIIVSTNNTDNREKDIINSIVSESQIFKIDMIPTDLNSNQNEKPFKISIQPLQDNSIYYLSYTINNSTKNIQNNSIAWHSNNQNLKKQSVHKKEQQQHNQDDDKQEITQFELFIIIGGFLMLCFLCFIINRINTKQVLKAQKLLKQLQNNLEKSNQQTNSQPSTDKFNDDLI